MVAALAIADFACEMQTEKISCGPGKQETSVQTLKSEIGDPQSAIRYIFGTDLAAILT
jgi:hypothetical protein